MRCQIGFVAAESSVRVGMRLPSRGCGRYSAARDAAPDPRPADPRALPRRDRRARQFRRLPPRPPGGGRAGGRARLPRAAAGDRRHLRSASGAPFQARRAALPPDHASTSASGCSPMPGRTRCWCSSSTPSWPSTSAEDFVAELLAEQIGAAGVVTGDDFTFGKGRGGNAAVLRELGAAARHRRRGGRAGAARRRAQSRRAGSARR